MVFSARSDRALATSICRRLEIPLGEHEEKEFEDGEHKLRPIESVQGRDVYLIASLHSDAERSVNDKLCRALFFLGALRATLTASRNLSLR
jgi:ribose-phosphate pyrophosphokinase